MKQKVLLRWTVTVRTSVWIPRSIRKLAAEKRGGREREANRKEGAKTDLLELREERIWGAKWNKNKRIAKRKESEQDKKWKNRKWNCEKREKERNKREKNEKDKKR